MSIVKTSLQLFAAWLLTIPSVLCGQEERATPLKVLFIGNSYTAVNDLPGEISNGGKVLVSIPVGEARRLQKIAWAENCRIVGRHRGEPLTIERPSP